MNVQEPQSTNREKPVFLALPGQGVMLLCLVALFAFIGPFGTYDTIGPLARLGYWSVALGVNWLVCASVNLLVLRYLAGASWPRRSLAVAAVSLLTAVPGTGVVFTAEAVFRPGNVASDMLLSVYLSVTVLIFAITSLVLLLAAARSPAPVRLPEARRMSGAERFLERLPEKIGRDIVCLTMADHYVEVFTTLGSTLILMRFADALAELEGAGGLRVHRSHWVSLAHVRGVLRREGRTILRLTGGREIPVSRGYLADARAAGLV